LKYFNKKYAGRYFFLLLALIILFIIRPFLEQFFHSGFILDVVLTFVLISGVYAACKNRSNLISSIVVAFLSFGTWWGTYFSKHAFLEGLGAVMGIIFFFHIALTILIDIFRSKEASIEVILGACCTYFLIGFGWGFIYRLTDFITPGSFQITTSDSITFSDYAYFSFVTLTTLGYGDITPLTRTTQMLAVFEAAIGQFYLAILIAGLVGTYISRNSQNSGS